ncbi:uncharacterized protein LOC128726767 [Anopheles nili]|uniref:uncharacterized protein LOC128726767 n=1 Tax=Anopheles nili TaxID=185578 RepID=UPI00237B74D0|nr:uncharacterized protein LOC128726767 [Anopheles nili]
MAEAQRLIGISLAKIAQSRVCRGGVSLHKNLLVATVLQKARYIFMEEAYHIVHGHYLQQQQQQQQAQQHQQLMMQENAAAAYLLAAHCDGGGESAGGDDKCGSGELVERHHHPCLLPGGEDELVDPVEEDDGTTATSRGTPPAYGGGECDVGGEVILPTTLGGLPLEPLNMCRHDPARGTDREEEEEEEDEEEDVVPDDVKDERQVAREGGSHDVSHLFLLPALAPWIGGSSSSCEDKENNVAGDVDGASGGFSSFLTASGFGGEVDEDDEEEEEDEEEDDDEEEEEENTCQDLSCHQRKPPTAAVTTPAEQRTSESVQQQFESAVRSKGAMRYFDLGGSNSSDRGGRVERRRRRHRTEGDSRISLVVPVKRRRSSTTGEWDGTDTMAQEEADERILPIALLSAKRMKTGDTPRAANAALLTGPHGQPQFYSSPHDTICQGDAETLSECVNQQLEAENLSTTTSSITSTGNSSSSTSTTTTDVQSDAEGTLAAASPPAPSVESIDRITSLVSIFSFGNLSRSVSTPDFCAAQAQKDTRPDAGGSLLTSQLQHHHHHHHGQRGYLTMTV